MSAPERPAATSCVCPHGVDLTEACYCQKCDDADGTTEAVAAMSRIGSAASIPEHPCVDCTHDYCRCAAASAAAIRQCPDPSKCYGVGCHGCDEPVISKMAPGYTDAACVPPGSDEALDLGCLCPVIDNGRGRGYLGGVEDEEGKTMFVVNFECLLHGVPPAKGEQVVAR